MKKVSLIIIFLISASHFICAQNRVDLHDTPGIYVLNSENSMRMMQEENETFRFFGSIGFSYLKQNFFGYDIIFEYNFRYELKDNLLEFVWTDETGEELGTFYADIRLVNHNFDFSYLKNINQFFSYGFGPSFVITNRIIELDKPLNVGPNGKSNFYDKLASSGLGVNAFLEFSIPFGLKSNFMFISRFKIRYTHSIWFDEGLRELDDYYQEFLTTELSLGIGYKF